MSFFSTHACDHSTKMIILNILKSSTAIPQAMRDLIRCFVHCFLLFESPRRNGLLAWICNAFQSNESTDLGIMLINVLENILASFDSFDEENREFYVFGFVGGCQRLEFVFHQAFAFIERTSCKTSSQPHKRAKYCSGSTSSAMPMLFLRLLQTIHVYASAKCESPYILWR